MTQPHQQNDFISICSVTELARKLGLSRTRIYQLQEEGVFPPPIHNIDTKRPFYPIAIQEKCLAIRKTGIGFNGQPVLFYSKQKSPLCKPLKNQDPKYHELANLLKQLGLKVSALKIKKAVKELNLDISKPLSGDGTVIRELFRYFNNGCQTDV